MADEEGPKPKRNGLDNEELGAIVPVDQQIGIPAHEHLLLILGKPNGYEVRRWMVYCLPNDVGGATLLEN